LSRAELQQRAEDRIVDAKVLLDAGRWPCAYYVAGYSLESGLKACILRYIEETGVIFREKKYLDGIKECWSHDLNKLFGIARLKAEFDQDCAANPNLQANWAVAENWNETSRYDQNTQADAESLYDAITNNQDGVLPWLRAHW
jgi:HEPN domain-containing protein